MSSTKHQAATLGSYVRIARPDHWIKQLFILPGIVLALLLGDSGDATWQSLLGKVVLALAATSLIASANYVINEWLDRDFDKFHPVKRKRPAVTASLRAPVVYAEWALLTLLGGALGWCVSFTCFLMLMILWVMGIVYNAHPFRTKDVAYLDVLSESVNNALRLLIGWFAILPDALPPSSVVVGYWMAGAYLMAIKRFSEYRAIGNPEIAGKYRRSFRHYTERSLLDSSFFYAMLSVFLVGVFLVKYHIEYVILVPFLCGLYVIYFNLAFQEDSAAQAPEKLYKEHGLIGYVAFLILLFILLTIVRIPALDVFLTPILIGI